MAQRDKKVKKYFRLRRAFVAAVLHLSKSFAPQSQNSGYATAKRGVITTVYTHIQSWPEWMHHLHFLRFCTIFCVYAAMH